MKVELHLHTRRYSQCAVASPSDLMAALTEAGYEAVFLTEHDQIWPQSEIHSLQQRFGTIRIFPGLERTICADPLQHLLILGTADPEYLAMTDPVGILRKARAEGHLTVLAHPFRWEGAAQILAGSVLPDAMEYHTYHQTGAAAQAAMAAAKERSMPLVNGGDVHAVSFIDRCWIQTAEPLRDGRDIRRIVLAGAYSNCMRSLSGVSMHRGRVEPGRASQRPKPVRLWREDAGQEHSALEERP